MNKTKKLMLALGEGSHTHIMHSDKDILHETNVETQQITFLLEDTGVVTHEEHDKIVLPKGKYKKYPQMEYDPFSRNLRAVFD